MRQAVFLPQRRLPRNGAPIAPHVFMALYGAGWAISFDVGVRIYVSEFVSVIGLFFVDWWHPLQRYDVVKSVLGAYLLWIVAIVVSDSVNGTSVFDSARAIATPLIGGASLLFVLANLALDVGSLLTFLAAIAIFKGILGEPLYGDEFADMSLSMESIQLDSNFVKVRITPFLTPAIALAACLLARRSQLHAAVLLLVASVGYFYFDARSEGLVLFLSSLVLAALHYRFRSTITKIIAAGLVGTILGYVAFVGYVNYTLTMEPNGHNAKQLARMSDVYNPFELILQGRSDWLVAADEVLERPIFGYGSWAIDVDDKYTSLMLERSGVGEESFEKTDGNVYLPVHSLILSTWVWSGLLGLASMVLLATVLTQSILKCNVNTLLSPAILVLSLGVAWHFFFSPPQMVRLFFPVPLAVMAVMARDEEIRAGLGEVLPER